MIPILYNATGPQTGMGLGPLKDAIKALVTEERNGAFYLDLECPVDDRIRTDRLIRIDAGHNLKGQLFRIKRVTKKSTLRMEIYAEHVSYLAAELPMAPVVNLSGTAQSALQGWNDSFIGPSPFTVWSDIGVNASSEVRIADFQNARRILKGVEGSILQRWGGGEYRFDNYRIELHNRRGTDANTLISYGRNLIDLEQEENIASTYSSVVPVVTRDGIQYTLPEHFVDSEHLGNFPNRRTRTVDFGHRFEQGEEVTHARLRELARDFIRDNDVGVPRVSLTLSYVDLSKAVGSSARLEEVNLCDWVPVRFERLGIHTKAQVTKTIWNVLEGRYEEIRLGDARYTLGDRLNEMERGIRDVANTPPPVDTGSMPNRIPDPIENLAAFGGWENIVLNWDFHGLNTAHFEVFASTVSGFAPSITNRIGRTTSNGFILEAGENRRYYFRIRAVNHHGTVGPMSAEVGASTADTSWRERHEREMERLSNIHDDIPGIIQDAIDNFDMTHLEVSLAYAQRDINNAMATAGQAVTSANAAFLAASQAQNRWESFLGTGPGSLTSILQTENLIDLRIHGESADTVFQLRNGQAVLRSSSIVLSGDVIIDGSFILGDSNISGMNASKLAGQIGGTQIAPSAISTPHLSANSVTTAILGVASVQAGNVAANAIQATHLAIGDFMNYAQLDADNLFGWTLYSGATIQNDPFFRRTGASLVRDMVVSTRHRCRGGEALRCQAEVRTSARGAATQGGAGNQPLIFRIQIAWWDTNGTAGWLHTQQHAVTNAAGALTA